MCDVIYDVMIYVYCYRLYAPDVMLCVMIVYAIYVMLKCGVIFI